MNKTMALGAAAIAAIGARALLGAFLREPVRGRVVLITGGSRGLGLLLARELGRRGARVAITARHAADLRRAHDELARMGVDVFAVPCDVTDPSQVRALVSAIEHAFGPVDVLVNNAGIITVGPFETMNERDYADAMATHFWGPLELVRAVAPSMRARGGGRIVNVSSIGGVVPTPHLLPYVASKFALRGLSEGLHAELAKDHIRVITVCPGLMRTGSARNAVFKGDHETELTLFRLLDALPLFSISGERAARRIARACEGRATHVSIGAPAKIAALAHGVWPSFVTRALGWMGRALPRSTDARARKGWRLSAPVARSPLVAFEAAAARRNNEITAEEQAWEKRA